MTDIPALRLAIAATMATHTAGASAAEVCRLCVSALPVDGAAFTTMTSDREWETLCVSDPLVAEVEELQFALGEGPCLLAFRSGRPVLLPDVTALGWTRWPAFAPAVADLPIGGLFSFPVQLGAITLGVFTLYRREPGSLSTEDVSQVLRVTDLAGAALLALRAGQPVADGNDTWDEGSGVDRRQVHQATGMLIAQLGVSAEEAFARLRGYAFAHNLHLNAVAGRIVARQLLLDVDLT